MVGNRIYGAFYVLIEQPYPNPFSKGNVNDYLTRGNIGPRPSCQVRNIELAQPHAGFVKLGLVVCSIQWTTIEWLAVPFL
jgi:hypothetical protein